VETDLEGNVISSTVSTFVATDSNAPWRFIVSAPAGPGRIYVSGFHADFSFRFTDPLVRSSNECIETPAEAEEP
jgi:hypothetical protein